MNSEASDLIADINSKRVVVRPRQERTSFPESYKEQIFYLWYNRGKPSENNLILMIPEELDEFARLPSIHTLKLWIDTQFVPRAKELDANVRQEMNEAVTTEKIEMMKRHAKLGVAMQDMAIKFLNDNAEMLNSAAAVRLLVEGVRIERESRGVSTALEKIIHMTDDQLADEVEKLLTAGNLTDMTDANSQ